MGKANTSHSTIASLSFSRSAIPSCSTSKSSPDLLSGKRRSKKTTVGFLQRFTSEHNRQRQNPSRTLGWKKQPGVPPAPRGRESRTDPFEFRRHGCAAPAAPPPARTRPAPRDPSERAASRSGRLRSLVSSRSSLLPRPERLPPSGRNPSGAKSPAEKRRRRPEGREPRSRGSAPAARAPGAGPTGGRGRATPDGCESPAGGRGAGPPPAEPRPSGPGRRRGAALPRARDKGGKRAAAACRGARRVFHERDGWRRGTRKESARLNYFSYPARRFLMQQRHWKVICNRGFLPFGPCTESEADGSKRGWPRFLKPFTCTQTWPAFVKMPSRRSTR